MGLLLLIILAIVFRARVDGNEPDRDAAARLIRVPDQYPSIDEAIEASVDGDHVVVRPGVYRESINFRGRKIRVSSEDPRDPGVVRSTVIWPTGRGTGVFFARGETPRSVLEGFTVTGGSGVLVTRWSVLGHAVRAGGGVFINHGSSPTLRHNVIEGNSADMGGGIYVSAGSAATIRDNMIRENSAVLGGGIRIAGDFSRTDGEAGWPAAGRREVPLVMACFIMGNSAHIGGGVSISRGASPEMSGSYLSDNRARWDGGGMAIWDSSSPRIRNTCYRRNACGDDYGFGGALSIINNCKPVIIDSEFVENSASGRLRGGGGAIAIHRSHPEIRQSMVRGNTAALGPGIYVWGSSEPRFVSNEVSSSDIFYGSTAM